jgi:hypothetical protein
MNYEIFSYILRFKEQFLVLCKSRSIFLSPKNYERVFVPSVLRNSFLYLPNYKTVYCALRITKQLFLRTLEQILVPFDLTKQFLVRYEFLKSLWLPPNHGTVSCVLRTTKLFLVYWELRNSTPS